ncbi:MAG: DNA-processing protein DprA [Jatrophihabitantaceae bacterium]
MDEVGTEVLLARAFLSRVGEPASIPVWELVRRLGPVAAASALRDGSAGPDALTATAARRDTADPEADLEAAERSGVRLVIPESSDWPHFAFSALERTGAARAAEYRRGARTHSESGEPMPPLALWVRGPAALASVGVRSVAIVGSRAATPYGEHVTAELAYGLARREVTVVSGGAYGIDAAAHRAALAADGTTVLVSAGGLDRPYPPGNATLFERVAETGLLVSESPPGCAPQRRRFLTRNRLIAALSTGTVVVEAANRSGAANTAKHAVTLQRPLMAVPGPVTSPMSAGCHDLIRREQALLVGTVEEVLAVVGGIGEGIDVPDGDAPKLAASDVRSELDRLDPTARRVFDGLLARRFTRPDEIASRSGVPPLDVIRALPTLELADLIESADGGYRIGARLRTRPTRASPT